MAVALLIRSARLLQGVLTIGFGLATLEHPWAGQLALAASLLWSAVLARQAWAAGGFQPVHGAGDVLVALFALGAAAISTPAHLITTSFYWALPYAQSAALVAACPRLRIPWATVAAPLALIAGYGLIVDVKSGYPVLAAASGNAVGIAGFYGAAALVAARGRGLARDLDRAQAAVRSLDEELVVRRTRLEEFRRLHDEAMQVLERAAAADQPLSSQLRTYARLAAAHLRQAMSRARSERVSLSQGLLEIASLSTELGFTIEVETMSALRSLDDACAELLLDAIREAVTNARKHSGADRAVVRVLTTGTGVGATVQDLGRGFDAATAAAGFGMTYSIRGRSPITTPAAWIESWRTRPSSGFARSTTSRTSGSSS